VIGMAVPVEWWHLGVALAVGLLVGLERERSGHRAVGVRTLGVAGLVGGVAAALSPYAVAGALVAAGALAFATYRRPGHDDPGATTEIALVAVVALGALAWSSPELAVGGAIAVALLLWAKGPIHRFARELVSDEDVKDALVFFVAAFIVLPLLPDTETGPYGVLNPQRIWLIVVLLTATGWAGYVATRWLGARRGLAITGFAGGFVSGAATTGAMARRARDEVSVRREALAAALLASVTTLVLLTIIGTYVSPEVLTRLAPSLIATGVVLLVEVGVLLLRPGPGAASAGEEEHARPFALGPAVVLALVLTGALLLARWGADALGDAGVVGSTALAGFADAHASALAAAQLAADGAIPVDLAALAVAAALATNTVTKVVLAFAAGGLRVGALYTALMLGPVLAFALPLALV
jgi:uncharacterized membrane protein (DUF4010 family)